jgi:transposase InsO family protein
MGTRGLTERRSLAFIGMSASSLRYQPRPDRNVELRARIVALAQRHRRYGVGMIHLKLRQAGELVNYKRVERLYRLEQLYIRRRRRKKIPVSERQPLIRPDSANQVWSMDFVLDRVAGGRTIKSLIIVDDATHESVAIIPEHTIGGDHLTRILDASAHFAASRQ